MRELQGAGNTPALFVHEGERPAAQTRRTTGFVAIQIPASSSARKPDMNRLSRKAQKYGKV